MSGLKNDKIEKTLFMRSEFNYLGNQVRSVGFCKIATFVFYYRLLNSEPLLSKFDFTRVYKLYLPLTMPHIDTQIEEYALNAKFSS